nr:CPBP family intramembrane metalloprotease [Clostridiales bacterium]
GLIFGILHLNLQQLPYAFCFGTAAALLTWISGSLWPAILMHALINAAQVLMARYEIVLLGSWAQLLPTAFVGALLTGLLFRTLYKALASDPS